MTIGAMNVTLAHVELTAHFKIPQLLQPKFFLIGQRLL